MYLIALTIVLLCFSIVTINLPSSEGRDRLAKFALFSTAYFRSFIVIALSLVFLIGRNLSTKFKKTMVHIFSLREDEPLVDFAFLWIITSVFMGIVDTVGVSKEFSDRMNIAGGAIIAQLMLLAGLIRSFITLRLTAKKSARRTKILNIPEDQSSEHRPEIVNKPRKPMNHLFDGLEKE
ncbi:hypothetical protein J5893_05995 [bacterium]|nr:hypothetical protein [bacterium]